MATAETLQGLANYVNSSVIDVNVRLLDGFAKLSSVGYTSIKLLQMADRCRSTAAPKQATWRKPGAPVQL